MLSPDIERVLLVHMALYLCSGLEVVALRTPVVGDIATSHCDVPPLLTNPPIGEGDQQIILIVDVCLHINIIIRHL